MQKTSNMELRKSQDCSWTPLEGSFANDINSVDVEEKLNKAWPFKTRFKTPDLNHTCAQNTF